MNRRRLLQAFAAATFAAVVEVTGVTPAIPKIDITKARLNFVQTIVDLWEAKDVARFYDGQVGRQIADQLTPTAA